MCIWKYRHFRYGDSMQQVQLSNKKLDPFLKRINFRCHLMTWLRVLGWRTNFLVLLFDANKETSIQLKIHISAWFDVDMKLVFSLVCRIFQNQILSEITPHFLHCRNNIHINFHQLTFICYSYNNMNRLLFIYGNF